MKEREIKKKKICMCIFLIVKKKRKKKRVYPLELFHPPDNYVE